MSKTFWISCFLVILSTSLFAKPQIKIHTDLIEDHLVPSIMVNGQTVLRIHDKGSYNSTFERAEGIYSVLMEVEEKGLNINKIRVRRYKDEYIGSVGKIKVFGISKGDLVANKSTAYNLAQLWSSNIKSAVNTPVETGLSGQALDLSGESNRFPLMAMFTMLDKLNFLSFLKYVFVFALIQAAVTVYVIRHFIRKEKAHHSEFVKKLHQVDNLQNTVQFLKQEITKLTKSLHLTERKSASTIEKKEAPIQKLASQE